MKLPIQVPIEDTEGLVYDQERALKEGLSEEVRIYSVTGVMDDDMRTQLLQYKLSEENARKFLDIFFDISANLEPGQVVTQHLVIKYQYDYSPELAAKKRAFIES